MSKYEFHPVADIFPLLEGRAFDEFCADIKANGLREPIWLHEGQIIDGRNRQRACDVTGVEPSYREWDGSGDLIEFAVSLNLHRRHLTESQRSMVAVKIQNLTHGGDRRSETFKVSNDTLKVGCHSAAKMLNISVASVKRGMRVRDKGTPKLVKAVEEGKVSVARAARIADLAPDAQDAEAERPTAASSYKSNATRASHLGNGNGKVESPVKGKRIEAVGELIGELEKLVQSPYHRYPYVKIKVTVDALREAFSRVVGHKQEV